MSKRRAARASANVQLFPFLAVLLCAMGALILLLVIITGQAKEQGQELRYEAVEQRIQLAEQRNDLQWRQSMVEQARDATSAQLSQARGALASLEHELRKRQDQLAELNAAESQTGNRLALEQLSLAELRDRLAKTKADVDAAEHSVDKKRRARSHTRDSFAVVPYQGPHATRRRPIYIECTSEAVVLQPEGIKLSEADFIASDIANNPLAAALRAAQDYIIKNRFVEGRDNGAPYPLLLVRPTGVGAYYAARAAMTNWGTEFGYELVDEDWQIDYLPPEQGLVTTMSRAIDDARQRTAVASVAAPGLTRGTQREVYRQAFAAGRKGNAMAASGGADMTDEVALANAQASLRGIPTSGGSGSASRGSSGRRGSGSGAGADAAKGPSPYDDVFAGGYGPNGSSPGGPVIGSGGGTRSANASLAGLSRGAPGGPMLGAPNQSLAGQPSNSGPSNAGQLAAGGQTGGTPQAGGTQPNANVNTSQQVGSDGQALNGNTAPGAATGSRYASNSAATMHNPTTPDSSGQAAPFGGTDPYLNKSSSGSSADPSSKKPAPFSTTGRTYGSSSDATSGFGSGGDGGGQGSTPSASFTAGQKQQAADYKANQAKRRSRDWALPERAPHAVPLTRPIQVALTAESLTLRAERGTKDMDRVIRLAPRTEDSVDELISKIWEHIGSWNIAGQGMYWRPVLVIDATPDAKERLAELQYVLQGSGLEVTVRGAPTTARR